MARGKLRIYLGAAPGVGKTYAMLQEASRRQERGTDVVVGVVETHGRDQTAAQLTDLELVSRREVTYRGTTLTELDVDAVIARRPEVVVVDELAHTNAPGSRNEKRWQDVEELLEAGIDVISTVNIQHLESMNDVVEQITGVVQQEVVPDGIVRSAEQVHLVDQTPEALRRRLAHGNVYPPDRVDAALDAYFRIGNLSALRELALMWVADSVDEGLKRYRDEHGIERTWDTRERVVVAITGAPGNPHVIRRAARIASRSRGELIGVHIRDADGLGRAVTGEALTRNREILQAVGGTYREVGAGDVAEALVRFAQVQHGTQIVLGASGRSRLQEIFRGSVINDVVRRASHIDVHVITPDLHKVNAGRPSRTPPANRPSRSRGTSPFSKRRRTWGWVAALLAPPILAAVLAQFRGEVELPTQLLAFTLVVATTAVIGGFVPAALAAVSSFLLVNWYFTPPIYAWTVADAENLLALLVFLADAAVIGYFVSSAARRAAEAGRERGDAETLAALAGASSAADDGLEAALDLLRKVLSATEVTIQLSSEDGWVRGPSSIDGTASLESRPGDTGFELALGEHARLVAMNADEGAVSPRILDAFCSQLADALERRRLRELAARADELSAANDLRGGLLAAVSHDLRTPIAAVQAAASTLAQPDVGDHPDLRSEFLATILEHTARLDGLVTNLLEMSRIQADAVQLLLRPMAVDEVLPSAIASIDRRGVGLDISIPADLPEVMVDPGLLERVLANLIDNACKWSPSGGIVRIDATSGVDIAVRVVDAGPGIPRDRRDAVVQPFQRLGDTDRVAGTGLGLAVVVGFLSQMGGRLDLDDTPGGGTTATVHLRRADDSDASS